MSKYGLTFGQARIALDIIKPWLITNQLVPEPPKNSGSKGIDKIIEKFFVTFTIEDGRVSNIFEIRGLKYEHDSRRESEKSGRAYNTGTIREYSYWAMNNNGSIEYITPEHLKDKIIATSWENYVPLPEFEINDCLANYMYLVCGVEKFENHPIHLKFA